MATLLSPQTQEKTMPSAPSNINYQSSSKRMTKCYQADQQVKYLHLEAEVEMLLQQLQTLKEQNQTLAKFSLKSAE